MPAIQRYTYDLIQKLHFHPFEMHIDRCNRITRMYLRNSATIDHHFHHSKVEKLH